MPTYTDLQEKVIDFRNNRNWRQFHSPKNSVLGLFVEIGELTRHFQYLYDKDLQTYITKHRDPIADELVDILWWILLISHDLDIAIDEAFIRKMNKNLLPDDRKKYKKVSMKLVKTQRLSEITTIILRFRKLRGWNTNNHPKDILLKMIEEIGELAKHMQWKQPEELTRYIQKHKEKIADEIVDVLICTLLLFHYLAFDIQKEFYRKMQKNRQKYPS